MEKKTNVGENEKRLICLNTRDRHEKGHGLGLPKPKQRVIKSLTKKLSHDPAIPFLITYLIIEIWNLTRPSQNYSQQAKMEKNNTDAPRQIKTQGKCDRYWIMK